MTIRRALVGFPLIAVIGYVGGMFISAVISGVAFASPPDTKPSQAVIAPSVQQHETYNKPPAEPPIQTDPVIPKSKDAF